MQKSIAHIDKQVTFVTKTKIMSTNMGFYNTIQSIKHNMKEDFLPANYFIMIDKGKKTCNTYQSLPNDFGDTEWIIVVAPYNWENLGYTNTSLKMIGMFNRYFVRTTEIPFGDWYLTGIEFVTHFGQYYNAWQPYPVLKHRLKKDKPIATNYKWTEKFGAFDINNMNLFLDAIWTFDRECKINK